MAQSGDILITLKSIDYPYPYTRGKQTQTHTLGFNVTNDGDLSFSWKSVSYEGSTEPSPQWWYVCSERPYHLDVEFSTDGNNWHPIVQKQVYNATTRDCSRDYHTYPVVDMIKDLVNQLGTTRLTVSGYVRIFTYAESAAPSASLPYAYPTSAYSSAVAIPIYIEVDYRPGEVRHSSVWKSTNRNAGACNIRKNGSWVEMKTQDGGTSTGDAPVIRRNGTWYNQREIGDKT